MSPSKLWIIAKLSMEHTTAILAALSEVNLTDAKEVQNAVFVDLSQSYERRWPDQYQHHVQRGTFPDWRTYLVDQMSPEQLRDTALRAAEAAQRVTEDAKIDPAVLRQPMTI